jgi:integrase
MGQNQQAPTEEKRTVARKCEYLTEAECEKLLQTAKGNRYGHRDYTMLLAVWRHGLRASEACDMEWSDIDFGRAEMHIRRAKLGKPAVHPVRGDELRALRRLERQQHPHSTFLFTTERGGPMTPDALNRMVKRLGGEAPRLPPPCPHASAGVRLQIGQRWPRHSIDPGLPRAQVDHVNGALHGTERYEVQKGVEVRRARASRQEKSPSAFAWGKSR